MFALLYVRDMGLYVQSSHHFIVWWQRNCASINIKIELLKGRCWIKWESSLLWTEKTKKNQRSPYNLDSACGREDWQLVRGKNLSSTSSNRIGKMWRSAPIFKKMPLTDSSLCEQTFLEKFRYIAPSARLSKWLKCEWCGKIIMLQI